MQNTELKNGCPGMHMHIRTPELAPSWHRDRALRPDSSILFSAELFASMEPGARTTNPANCDNILELCHRFRLLRERIERLEAQAKLDGKVVADMGESLAQLEDERADLLEQRFEDINYIADLERRLDRIYQVTIEGTPR